MDTGATLVSILGAVFSFLDFVVSLRNRGEKVPDEKKLELLGASAALIQQLVFCKDVHHSFYSFRAGTLHQFQNKTKDDFGDSGLIFRLIDGSMGGDDNRECWSALTSRFKGHWREVERNRARQMDSVLTRAKRTHSPDLSTTEWEIQPPEKVKIDAETLLGEFVEMLQCIEDFTVLFGDITFAAASKNRDKVKMVPTLLVDLDDKAEDVMLHADGAIVASVSILAHINEATFPGGNYR